jgi:hypothetical protein
VSGDNFEQIYGDVRFDLDEGYDVLIPKLHKILASLDQTRCGRLEEAYSDVLRNIEFSSDENKNFLFDDLASAIDLSCDGWTFGPEEEFSVVYGFWRI